MLSPYVLAWKSKPETAFLGLKLRFLGIFVPNPLRGGDMLSNALLNPSDIGQSHLMEEFSQNLRVRFLGAAGTVTGSKFLLSFNHKKFLIDCGLFQGLKALRLKNWDRFPIEPAEIDGIFLTHAHVDHCGYIPRLVKDGFKGSIYCTAGTFDIARIILADTGHLQEEEARYLGKHKLSKHRIPKALFTREEAEQSFEYFVPQKFNHWIEIAGGLQIQFLPAGHILGAAMIHIRAGDKTLLFSGDLGRQKDPLFLPPTIPPPVDYLVVESTYGQKLHPQTNTIKQLANVITLAHEKNGVVLIPAFTVGRAQTLLHFLAQLKQQKRIPALPIYLNSPMATLATQTFCEHLGTHRLSKQECDALLEVAQFVETPEASKQLNERKGPMLIISASGMLTGGRILHHLKSFAGNPNNFILLSGFQAAGTRGRALQDGARELKIHQQMVEFKAQVLNLENLSAHADQNEILQWLAQSGMKPKKVFIVHGEPEASLGLAKRIETELNLPCLIPGLDEEYSLA